MRSLTGHLGNVPFLGIAGVTIISAVSIGPETNSQKSFYATLIAIFAVMRAIWGYSGRGMRIEQPAMVGALGCGLLLAGFQLVSGPWGGPFTSDPYNTALFILVFGSLVLAFEVLSVHVSRSDIAVNVLVGLVIFIGFGSAVFGIATSFYPGFESFAGGGQAGPGTGFGQFANRNHFALLMEMSGGLLLGMLIGGPGSSFKKIAGFILLAVMGYAVVATLSRGGLVGGTGMIVFSVMVVLMLRFDSEERFRDRGGKVGGWFAARAARMVLAVSLSLFVGLVVWAGISFVGGDQLASRTSRIDEELLVNEKSRLNRHKIWQSTWELFKEYPIAGSGLGAYAESIPPYDTSSGLFRLEQAHNEYLEVLATGGLAGFAILVCVVMLAARSLIKNLRECDRRHQGVYIGAGTGLFGVAIHSVVDFGLHISLNALLFVILLTLATAGRRPDSAGNSS